MIIEQSTRAAASDYVEAAAKQFEQEHQISEIRNFGTGKVNDTFLVNTSSGPEKYFILQRINPHVFRKPELIMQNLRVLSVHISKRLTRNSIADRRWEMPRVLSAADTSDFWIDPGGFFWRAISFIENSESLERVHSLEQASEVGFAIGTFHNLVSDLPAVSIHNTLADFHITPVYLRHYEEVLKRSNLNLPPDAEYCIDFINSRKEFVHILESAKAQGRLPIRIIHGDPKISNIMVDTATRQAVSIVDLDTVMPGLVLYDIGDSLRSCCNMHGEDSRRPEDAQFDPELCQALLKGYFSAAKNLLGRHECEFIYDAVRLIALELGIRFFCDYLEGNVYFKVADVQQNLGRAIVQFRLTESIEAQEKSLRSIITGLI